MRTRRNIGLIVLVAVVSLSGSAEAGTGRDLGRITARAAVVADARTGEILFARNPTAKLPPASTTKVLTALVALDSGGFEQNFRVSRYASSMEPSKIWLRPGWTMNMKDLLYATLLNSANDASVALAEGVAGTVGSFSRLMNEKARSLGAAHSNFVNPNGLPSDQHYSTAFDLAQIMRHAAQVPELRDILSTGSKVIYPRSGSKRRIALYSHNRFRDRKDVPVLGKTGYTRKARKCFVGVASDGRREVIVAMLGSDQLWPDVERLVAYGIGQSTPPAEIPSDTNFQEASVQPRRGPAPAQPAETYASIDAWERAAAPPARVTTTAETSPRPQQAAPQMGIPKQANEKVTPGFLYHVQLASFRSRVQADRLRRRVGGQGYRASIERSGRGKRLYFKVTVRDFASRDSARRAARVLAEGLRVEPLILAARI